MAEKGTLYLIKVHFRSPPKAITLCWAYLGRTYQALHIKAEAGGSSGKLLNCCWARWHLETRRGSSHHCLGFFRDVSPSQAVTADINPPSSQVGLKLCYIFLWPKPPSMPSSAHEDPLGSLFAKIRMWNFFIWTSWFWSSPEAAHPKLPQTEADAPSQWPLIPLMSQPMSLTPHTSEVHNPNAPWRTRGQRFPTASSRESLSHTVFLHCCGCPAVQLCGTIQCSSWPVPVVRALHAFVPDSCYLF